MIMLPVKPSGLGMKALSQFRSGPAVRYAGFHMAAHILQLSRSRGGAPTLPLPAAAIPPLATEGDRHADTAHHGGPERALCLFAVERNAAIAAEGHAITPGATGENITTEGLDWDLVVPGVRLRFGSDVLVEVTRYTTPCKTNQRWFTGGNFNRMHQDLHPGFSRVYARVLETGILRPGDAVEIIAG
jgi:MOSC domain-containing protein YiiM